jgi:mono/diheme cytochrome c family protein
MIVSHCRLVLLQILSLCAGLLPGAHAGQVQGEESRVSVLDGVYTSDQAIRGETIYQQQCQSCHAADMAGGPAARGLLGLAFQFLWKEKTLADLFTAMREKMPPGSPGTLDDQAYIDILAAILQRNGFPAVVKSHPTGNTTNHRDTLGMT